MSKQVFQVSRVQSDLYVPLGKLVASGIPSLCRGLSIRGLLLGSVEVVIQPCFRTVDGEWSYLDVVRFPVVDGAVQHGIQGRRKSSKVEA